MLLADSGPDPRTELRELAARIPTEGRAPFAQAFFLWQAMRPKLLPLLPVILYELLGPTLPGRADAAAVLWGAAHLCALEQPASVQRAGFQGTGLELGEAL